MGRALNQLIGDLAESVRTLARTWTTFWYTPADPTLLGVLRILTGLMLLYTHAVWGLALHDFFGANAWLSADLVRLMQENQFAYSFWWLVPEGAVGIAHAVSMLILLLFTVGFATKLTSILSLIVAISYAYRVPDALFGLDQINIMLTLYLSIGPSGRALSVDRWLARRRQGGKTLELAPSVTANVAQRLIQVHMCIIYFFAGTSKLQGYSWWSGEAMWRAFANLEYQSIDMTWLAWHPWLVNVMTHVTIFWEVFFCVLIWQRAWRPVLLIGAVVLHVGIGAFLGMWTFALIMLVGCASFLPNQAVRELVAALVPARSSAPPNPVPSLWTGQRSVPEASLSTKRAVK